MLSPLLSHKKYKTFAHEVAVLAVARSACKHDRCLGEWKRKY